MGHLWWCENGVVLMTLIHGTSHLVKGVREITQGGLWERNKRTDVGDGQIHCMNSLMLPFHTFPPFFFCSTQPHLTAWLIIIERKILCIFSEKDKSHVVGGCEIAQGARTCCRVSLRCGKNWVAFKEGSRCWSRPSHSVMICNHFSDWLWWIVCPRSVQFLLFSSSRPVKWAVWVACLGKSEYFNP